MKMRMYEEEARMVTVVTGYSCDRGFESHPGRGCLSVLGVVCCQVEVSATN